VRILLDQNLDGRLHQELSEHNPPTLHPVAHTPEIRISGDQGTLQFFVQRVSAADRFQKLGLANLFPEFPHFPDQEMPKTLFSIFLVRFSIKSEIFAEHHLAT
jgi:hypothetical protein